MYNDDTEFLVQPLSARKQSRRPTNPLRARLGALCAIGLLATPVAFAIRGSGRSVDLTAAPTTMAARVVAAPAPSPVVESDPATAPATAAAPVVVAPAAPVLTAAPVDTVGAAPASSAAAPVVPVTAPPVAATTPATAPATVPAVAAAGPTPSKPVVNQATNATVVTAPPTTAAPVTTPPPTTVPATAPANNVAPVDISKCAKTYKVVAGDYWIRIAKKIAVSLDSLLDVNNADVGTALFPGRTICAPANATPPTTAPPVTPSTSKPPSSSTNPPAPTTTAAPPPTATTIPRPANTYTSAQVQQIIRDVWPDDQEDKAIAIAWRESNHNPTVRNYCCYGLFQIYYTVHKTWLNAMGVTSAAMLWDPRVNATAAYALYQRAGGWGPWGG